MKTVQADMEKPEDVVKTCFLVRPYNPHTQLLTYSGEPIPVVGQLEVEVGYEGQLAKLPLVVVEREGPSLFGPDWLSKICLDWKSINEKILWTAFWAPTRNCSHLAWVP